MAEALRLSPEQARELRESARPTAATGGQVTATRPETTGKTLWIAVLGPVAVWMGGEPVDIGSDAQRVVLGLLAIRHGLPVRPEAISTLLYGEQWARSSRDPALAWVSRLRRTLRAAEGGGQAPRLTRARGAYTLSASAAELDLAAFRELARRAAEARKAGDRLNACRLYERAFQLCHDEPCADLILLQDHPALIELRHELADELLSFSKVAGDLGRHDMVLRRLESLAAADPLNERAQAHLMIALAACGQQARALSVYEDLRKRLDDELGIDPGEELAAAHLRVLRQDTGGLRAPLQQAEPTPGGDRAARRAPRQLLPAPRCFAGFQDELALLDNIWREQPFAGGAPVAAIVGGAGIGKTSLAAYWTRRVADHFGDGQLFADLRGDGPGGQQLAPAEVAGRFLTALGVAGDAVPPDPDARLALYHALLEDRRILVLLDNAGSAEQVRALLPMPPGCFALVTSRNRLTGLAVSHGARLLPLENLSPAESRELLLRGFGAARVTAEAHAVDDIIAACSGLPLALSSVVAQAAGHPGQPLAKLAAGLREPRIRLDTLDTRDTSTSVRAAFSRSAARLTSRSARIFYLLGLHPAGAVTAPEAASLAAVPLSEARHALAEICDEHLLTEHVPGRYRAHELVRAYATEAVQAQQTHDELRSAEHRLLDHYLHTIGGAWKFLLPHRAPLPLPFPLPGVTPVRFRSPAEALDWLHAEGSGFLAAITRAAKGGFTPHAWELPRAVAPFLREDQQLARTRVVGGRLRARARPGCT